MFCGQVNALKNTTFGVVEGDFSGSKNLSVMEQLAEGFDRETEMHAAIQFEKELIGNGKKIQFIENVSHLDGYYKGKMIGSLDVLVVGTGLLMAFKSIKNFHLMTKTQSLRNKKMIALASAQIGLGCVCLHLKNNIMKFHERTTIEKKSAIQEYCKSARSSWW